MVCGELDAVRSVPLDKEALDREAYDRSRAYKCRPGLVRLWKLVCGNEEDLLDLGPECTCRFRVVVLEEVDFACWAADRVCVGVRWGKGYVR